MALHFYHPNKAIKGFATSFWYSGRENSIFATILKQSGWDAEQQNGTFKANVNDPNGKVNVKLDSIEVAAILDCIERGRDFKAFHDSEETPKQITFSMWMGQDGKPRGYSFSVTVTSKVDSSYKNSFYIGLSFAEGRCLREYLILCLHKKFSAELNYVPIPAVTVEDITNNNQNKTEEAPKESAPIIAVPSSELLNF